MDKVRIVIEVEGDQQARQTLTGVKDGVGELRGAAGAATGPLEDMLAQVRDLSARNDGLGDVARDVGAIAPAAGVGAASMASLGVAVGAASTALLAYGAVARGVGDLALEAYRKTAEGREAFAEMDRSAARLAQTFGDRFRPEVDVTVDSINALLDAANDSPLAMAVLEGAVRGVLAPFLSVATAASTLREGLEAIGVLRRSLDDELGKDVARAGDVDDFVELERLRVGRQAERIAAEKAAAEQAARELQKSQDILREIALVGADDETVAASRNDELRRRAEAALRAGEERTEGLALLEANLTKDFEANQQKRAELAAEANQRIILSSLEGEERIRAELAATLAKVEDTAGNAAEARVAATEKAERDITELRERAEEERQRIRDKAEKEEQRRFERRVRAHQQVQDQVLDLEREAALASLTVFEQIELKRRESIDRIAGNVNASLDDIERATAAAAEIAADRTRDAQERIFDEQQRHLERGLQDWERFWDRVDRRSRRGGDFFGSILDEMQTQFRRSVIRMVGSLLLGQQQAAGPANGGIGGNPLGVLLGGLGGVFGGGGSGGFGGAAGVGATPPFVQNAFPGSTPPFVPGAAGSIPSARIPSAAGPLGGLLGGLFGGGGGGLPGNPGPALGLLLGSAGDSPASAALLSGAGILGGTALSGIAAGVAGGVGPLAGLGVAFGGLLTNPVGLAVAGGIVGVSALLATLGRGKKKTQAAGVANAGFANIDEIVDDFRNRELRYEQAVLGMDRQWEEMVAAWNRIGGSVGRRSIATQSPFFEQRVEEVDRIQNERLRRLGVIEGLPLPEFHFGGRVPGQGQVPVMALGGEYVIRREVVEQVGVRALDSINAGRGGGGDLHLTINVNGGAAGVESYVRSGDLENAIARSWRELKKQGRVR